MREDDVIRLTRLVELKDQCTAAHTWRVALYTQALAEAMGIEQELVVRLMRGAALHDIGKIDIPRQVLVKAGPLTAEERTIIEAHPMLGYERLVAMGERDPLVLTLVRSHHERLDGSGYPDRLRGQAVPVAARIFAVVDTFDAMTSIRPYRQSVDESSVSAAIEVLREASDRWYWADAVEMFLLLHEQGRLDWIRHHFNDVDSLSRVGAPGTAEELLRAASDVPRNGK